MTPSTWLFYIDEGNTTKSDTSRTFESKMWVREVPSQEKWGRSALQWLPAGFPEADEWVPAPLSFVDEIKRIIHNRKPKHLT